MKSKFIVALALFLALSSLSFAQIDKSNPELEYVPGQVIVVYKSTPTTSPVAERVERIGFKNFTRKPIELLTFDSSKSVNQMIAEVKKNANVLSATPNRMIRLSTLEPADLGFTELWGLNNTGQTGGTVDADIDAPEAWAVTTGSKDVVIGVIDSGIDYAHPDLIDNLWTNPQEIPGNGIDDDNNGIIDDIHGARALTEFDFEGNVVGDIFDGDPMDDDGHGTHVAGTIGAKGNNEMGVSGVNWDVSIVACKFLGATGGGTTYDALRCLDYMAGLVQAGVNLKAINNSWGGPSNGGPADEALDAAFEQLNDLNVVVVNAAGNDASNNEVTSFFPSDSTVANVISVASTDHNDDLSTFSNYGVTRVDIGAPGSAILSTVPGGGYQYLGGTSMAAPHVTGAIALAATVFPEMSALELKELILCSGDSNPRLIGRTVTGKRLNVANAVTGECNPEFVPYLQSESSQRIALGESASFSFSIERALDWDKTVTVSVIADEALPVSISANGIGFGETTSIDIVTTAETITGSFPIEVQFDDGEKVKSQFVNLEIVPFTVEFSYTNNTVTPIPDNDPVGVNSTVTVDEELGIFEVGVAVDITHTWSGDLVLTLISPNGTSYVLREQQGGSSDDIVESYLVPAGIFTDEPSIGDWILNVVDTFGADVGVINSWTLSIFADEYELRPPVVDFNAVAEGLTVDFTDLTTDLENNVETWTWDFGDGNSSSEQNASHSYAAAGTYTVTLTVTDADGFTSSSSQTIVVIETFSLTKRFISLGNGNLLKAFFTWSLPGFDTVDILVDGIVVATVNNNGYFYYLKPLAERKNYSFRVCVSGTIACSSELSTDFRL